MKLHRHLQPMEGREGGTYVVMTRDNAWGRGDTLAEAVKEARRAGGRKFKIGDVLVAWQPASAHTGLGEGKEPYVNDYGAVCYYGEPGSLQYLIRPE